MTKFVRHEHYHYYPGLDVVQDVGRKVDILLSKFHKLEEALMATRDEVRAKLEQTLDEVRQTRGAAASAIKAINDLKAQIKDAAATSADLDEFNSKLGEIIGESDATEGELKAAIEANPTPTP